MPYLSAETTRILDSEHRMCVPPVRPPWLLGYLDTARRRCSLPYLSEGHAPGNPTPALSYHTGHRERTQHAGHVLQTGCRAALNSLLVRMVAASLLLRLRNV